MLSVPKELITRTVLSHTLLGRVKRSLPYSLALGRLHSFVAALGQNTTYKLAPHTDRHYHVHVSVTDTCTALRNSAAGTDLNIFD